MLYRLAIRYQGEILSAKTERFNSSDDALFHGRRWFDENLKIIKRAIYDASHVRVADTALDLRVSYVEEQLDMFSQQSYEVSGVKLGD